MSDKAETVRPCPQWTMDSCHCPVLKQCVRWENHDAEVVKKHTPERRLDQRLSALQKANDIRAKRARLKKDLKAGRVNPKPLLEDPPEYIHTMKVEELLRATPKIGRVKAMKYMNRVRISASKSVGGMSERQRMELVAEMR